MRLVVFDIDGTLTETNEIDAECFLATLAELYEITELTGDWERYPHVTDACIFRTVFTEHHGRAPGDGEIGRFQEVFFARLEAAGQAQGVAIIPGAPKVLPLLANEPANVMAIATGCWSASARWKLAHAGIRLDDFPHATADDAEAREEIMQLAIRRAMASAGRESFASVVYVGDAVWDARACRKLGLPLLGIGSGQRAQRLREHGVEHVLADYTDPAALLASLDALSGRSAQSRMK